MISNHKNLKVQELRANLKTRPSTSILTDKNWKAEVKKASRAELYTAYLKVVQLDDPTCTFIYDDLHPKYVKINPENPLQGLFTLEEPAQLKLGLHPLTLNLRALPSTREGEIVQEDLNIHEEPAPELLEGFSTPGVGEEALEDGSTVAIATLSGLFPTEEKALIFRSLLKSWLQTDPVHCCFLTSAELTGDILLNWLIFLFKHMGDQVDVGGIPTLLGCPVDPPPHAGKTFLLSRRVLAEELTCGVRSNLGALASANLAGPLRTCVFNCVSGSMFLELDMKSLELRTLLPGSVLLLPLTSAGVDFTFNEARLKLEILKKHTQSLVIWALDAPFELDSPTVIQEMTSHLALGEGTSCRGLLAIWVEALLRKKDSSKVGVKDAMTAFLDHTRATQPSGHNLCLSWNVTAAKFAPLLKDVLETVFAYPLNTSEGTYLKKGEGYALINFTICNSTNPQDTAGTSQLVPVAPQSVHNLRECI